MNMNIGKELKSSKIMYIIDNLINYNYLCCMNIDHVTNFNHKIQLY